MQIGKFCVHTLIVLAFALLTACGGSSSNADGETASAEDESYKETVEYQLTVADKGEPVDMFDDDMSMIRTNLDDLEGYCTGTRVQIANGLSVIKKTYMEHGIDKTYRELSYSLLEFARGLGGERDMPDLCTAYLMNHTTVEVINGEVKTTMK
jgi:hypothetical protein